MRAALVSRYGEQPTLGEFAGPAAGSGETLVTVAASAISNLTRGRAAGTHYSAEGVLPFVVGVDGTGTDPDGRPVYFFMPRAPFGSMAERTPVALRQCVPVPDGLDKTTAAALANPGMSSWAALVERAHLLAGETVLVNGATGASGGLAVQIARRLGAARVIATGRNPEALAATRALGADDTIALGEEEEFAARLRDLFAEGVDVVVDYLWGASAAGILRTRAAARSDRPLRFVQVGAMSGDEVALPAALLRAAPITLTGSGLGSVSDARLLATIGALFDSAAAAPFVLSMDVFPFDRFAEAWASRGARAVVSMAG